VTRKRILIVDDSPLQLAVAHATLADAGYDVTTHEGANEIETAGFDLILLDVELPNQPGDEIAKTLRRTAPIYLYSTLPADELRRRVAAARLDGWISKQGLDHLVAAVDRILG
jgi:two-component system, chemotaxis family, chemotaxis protein CheY